MTSDNYDDNGSSHYSSDHNVDNAMDEDIDDFEGDDAGIDVDGSGSGNGHFNLDGDIDVDIDGEGEAEGDVDGDPDDDDDVYNEEDDDHEDNDNDIDIDSSREFPPQSQHSPGQNPNLPHLENSSLPTPHHDAMVNGDTRPISKSSSPNDRSASLTTKFHHISPDILNATTYDIVPTIAAPHSTSINTVCATLDMRWVFTGGSDGYIRKFNWYDTVNGKLPLTVAQRHPFVDSVQKAGVLVSYWDNEQAPDHTPTRDNYSPSPVYSLAVHYEALWILSGLESGGINLQSVRHSEGTRIACLRGHTSAVSVLSLDDEQVSLLSGSWDKLINDWDLNTGQITQTYRGCGGQISCIERRPLSSTAIPSSNVQADGSAQSETFSSNNDTKFTQYDAMPNGVSGSDDVKMNFSNSEESNFFGGNLEIDNTVESPDDLGSLFGDDTHDGLSNNMLDLFGDSNDQTDIPSAVSSELTDAEIKQEPFTELSTQNQSDLSQGVEPINSNQNFSNGTPLISSDNELEKKDSNGLNSIPNLSYKSEAVSNENLTCDTSSHGSLGNIACQLSDNQTTSSTTFFDAAYDGTIRIWDRRQSNPVAQITPSRSTPPWCMGACWSPDGNFIYAGRRNNTVEEFSIHKGLSQPNRTFRFPSGSGPVSSVKVMPNGKHLICASHDILRLYDLRQQESTRHSAVPFLIIPGHRTGVISQLYLDPTSRFLISTAGTRGWEGSSTEVLLGYEIAVPN